MPVKDGGSEVLVLVVIAEIRHRLGALESSQPHELQYELHSREDTLMSLR